MNARQLEVQQPTGIFFKRSTFSCRTGTRALLQACTAADKRMEYVNVNKKIELMLTRRAKAYNSSSSVV